MSVQIKNILKNDCNNCKIGFEIANISSLEQYLCTKIILF